MKCSIGAGWAFLVVLVCFSCGGPGFEGTSTSGSNLGRRIETWIEMWNTYDLDRIDELFLQGDRLTYFSSEKEGIISGIESVKEHHRAFGFVAGGKDQPNRLWLEDIRVNKFGPSAVVTAIWFFQRPEGIPQRGPVTMVWIFEDGEFGIAHMNFSNYPLNPSGLPDVPEGAQAISITGEPLFPAEPGEDLLAKLKEAAEDFEADPDNIENFIWYGRRTAYTGNYRAAIRIFTEGIPKYPKDARLYRHRGHRYISIREFDRAIRDFERAVSLIEGKEDSIEPDGMPNAKNIPVSTLHTNIWYHLGLAYYLSHDLENALRAYRRGIRASTNDDMLVATTHWLYMTLRRLGQDGEAEKALEPILEEMNVIENTVYHRLCLFYQGKLGEKELTGDDFSNIMSDALAYGLGCWRLYNGRKDEAWLIYKKIIENKSWASFGFIAAEADLAEYR